VKTKVYLHVLICYIPAAHRTGSLKRG